VSGALRPHPRTQYRRIDLLPLVRVLLVACCVGWSISSTAAAQVTPVGQDWVTQRPQEGGFRLLAPPNWQRRTPRGPNVRILVAPPAGAGLGFANCNVVVRRVDGVPRSEIRQLERALSSGVLSDADWRDILGGIMTGMQVSERRSARVSNLPAQMAITSGSYENLNVRIWMSMINVVLIDRGRMFHAACGAGDGNPQGAMRAFEFWRPTLMAILGTWVIENY